jgi:hypothetical protein
VAASTVTAVVAAEADARGRRLSSPCQLFICDEADESTLLHHPKL